MIVSYLLSSSNQHEISWQEFVRDYLTKGFVESVTVYNKDYVRVKCRNDLRFYYFKIGSVDTFERNFEQIQNQLNIDVMNRIPVFYKENGVDITKWLSLLATFGLIYFMYSFAKQSMRGMGIGLGKGGKGGKGIFGIVNTTAKLINPKEIDVKFKDVAGCEEAKLEIMEFVNFLKNPKQYHDLGARIPVRIFIFYLSIFKTNFDFDFF